jgi:hypothetical protein
VLAKARALKKEYKEFKEYEEYKEADAFQHCGMFGRETP